MTIAGTLNNLDYVIIVREKLFLCFCYFLLLFCICRYKQIADHLYKKEAIQTGYASAIAHEVLSSIRTVYAFNAQKKEIERYTEPLAKAKKIYIKKGGYFLLFRCLIS